MHTANPSRWLVVDDEPGLSEIIADTLAALGLADVEPFTSSTAALRSFAANHDGYDLVITDRDMPGLDGMEFSRRLHEHAPGVPIILVSAHTDDLTEHDLRRAGIGAVLNKPFSLGRLEAAARCANAGRISPARPATNPPVLMAA